MQPTPMPLAMRTGALRSAPTRARWATLQIQTDDHTYLGRVYVPETKKRVSDVLEDDRQFLFMTEVSMDHSAHVEPFLALNKRFVKAVRVLHDGEAESVSRSA